CVDEATRYAVALLGGHHGANELARRVSVVLGCEPVITTASDSANIHPLDSYGADLGFRIADPALLAPIGARILSGEPVTLRGAERWPLPALPVVPVAADSDGDASVPEIEITDRDHRHLGDGPDQHPDPSRPRLVYHSPSLVVGVGASRGVSADEVLEAVDKALAAGRLSPLSVARLASVDAKSDEPGILEAAERRGWPVVFHPASRLAPIDVPNPSAVVLAEVGTPSVAEAAARFDGAHRPLADLVVPKTLSRPRSMGDREVPMATAAVARLRPRGRLALIGLGPGARDLLPPRAVAELRRASVVIGLDQYLDQIRDLLRPGTEVRATGLGSEEARAKDAVETARSGRAVALVGSGDSGMYAMASPALDLFDDLDDVDVVGVPGITASLAASNILGAPLGHDHAVISLSDLHTPWEAIERRVRAAAEGDFVTVFYNPRSRGRDWQLGKALEILAAHRPPTTPVGCVRDASRPGERSWVSTLADFDPSEVDMYTVVLVGSSQSRVAAGRVVTPRGYTWHS
ncbi:MAG TPA: precorrin-3B C(17)-methyltransferase, partial [Candidatus Limnocylindrales bacterium]|nr:precorrin-3B C(17)-methyltransferase [Candidatus Limnocylindrales bacterium]